MKAAGLLLLVVLVVTQAKDSIFVWTENDAKHDRGEFHSWVTAEQKAALAPLKERPQEMHDKILDFFKQLPSDKQAEWNKFYRKECVSWVMEVADESEIKELQDLERQGDKEALIEKINGYKSRLAGERREKVDLWEDECTKLLKELPRKRRELDTKFKDFTAWMTEEQRKTLSDLKASGKTFEELREKTKEFFSALPSDKQDSLREEFKAKCKAFFTKISTPEEVENMKKLHESGSDAEVQAIIKEVISRQSGDEKTVATKMESLCTDVFSKKKTKRDIDEKINRRLSWMTASQKKEIKEMYSDGKPQTEIRAKIFQFLSALDGPAGKAAKDHIQKDCYAWMDTVATADEIAALHKMHETDHAGCKKKVREFIQRLPEGKKEEVEKNLPFCEKVWYGEHEHHHHGHRRHLPIRRRRHLHAIDKFLDWLQPEQRQELEELENSGSHFDNVLAKVKEFYNALPEERKADLRKNFKDQCSVWVKEVATPEEFESIKKLHEAKDHVELKKKLMELEGRLTEEQKHTVEHVRDVCFGVWEVEIARRRRHIHDIQEGVEKFLSWMSDDQKKKVKALYESGDKEAFYKEIFSAYDSSADDVKAKATEELKAACKHYGKDVMGEENIKVITNMKDSGASHEAITKKIEEIINAITDPEKKAKAERIHKACKKIYGTTRTRRDHHHHTLDEAFDKYLTWLSESQKAEVKALKESGDKEGIYKKIMQLYEESSGDVKEKAKEELQSACKHYVKEYVGEEKAAEFKRLRESGTPMDELSKKVEQAIEEIADDVVKSKAKKASALCKRVFGAARRFRRDHHKHTLEEALENYLTWLSDEQKAEVKSIYSEGNKPAAYEKVMHYFDSATGETKEKAAKELKEACRHYIKDLIGEENGNEIKQMKESGAKNDEIATRVEEMIEAIVDDKKKADAVRVSKACKKVYGVATRYRRDHHLHKLDEAMEKFLTWLDDEQKSELRKIFESEDRSAVYKKVLEYYESTAGDVKEKALAELKSACKHYVKDSIGEENFKKIKEMKESGASKEEISAKITEFVSAITNEEKKAQGERAVAACKKIHAVTRRFKRDHDYEHKFQEMMKNYLTWLTDDQKADLKKLHESGEREAVYNKVMQLFEAAEGDTKEKAVTQLKAACKHYLKDHIGEANAEKVKEMKDSGATNEAISAKIDEFVAAITDEKKKESAERANKACKKVFGVARRFRRDDDYEHRFKEMMENYLTWLTDDQKADLKKLHEAGEREAVFNKVMQLFEAAEGDTKEKAVTQLKAACKHYLKDHIGEANAEKVKEMKDSGATNEAISAKINEFIAAITDEKKKERAERANKACKKVFGVARRFKRDHHEHKFEEAMEKYLTWMTDGQKAEVKGIYEAGDREAVYKRVMELFDEASGEVKEKATEDLKAACRHYMKDFIGEENVDQLKEMKESGATPEQISAKVNEFIAAIADEKKKEKAERAKASCRKIYGLVRRFRRDHDERKLEEAMEKYLGWLRDEQKAEVKKIYGAGDRIAVQNKVMEWFEGTTGDVRKAANAQLRAACKHYLKEFIGSDNVEEIKKMKDSGATNEQMSNKIDEFVAAMTDEEKKSKAEAVAKQCKKIYGVMKEASRRRRHLSSRHYRDFLRNYFIRL